MDILNQLNTPYEYSDNGNNNLIIFLPSARPKKIYPYYPRISWKNEFSEQFDILYLADPFQDMHEYHEYKGSWFISKSGYSVLPEIAKTLIRFIAKKKYDEVLFYGSSMGGYASIILGSLIDGSTSIAECPQIFLDKYPSSQKIIQTFCSSKSVHCLPDPVQLIINNRGASQFYLVTNLYDHHIADHINPFIKKITSGAIREECSLNINIEFYSLQGYEKWHTALKLKEAKNLILRVISQWKGETLEKFLLLRPLGGLNDIFNQIYRCSLYCIEHQRTLVIDTNDCNFSDEFSNYFIPRDNILNVINYPEWVKDNDINGLTIYPPFLKNNLMSYQIDWDNKQQVFHERTSKKPISFDFQQTYSESIIIHHACGGGLNGGKGLNYFTIQPFIKKQLTERLDKLGDDFLAIHIRNTDLKTNYKEFFEKKLDYIKKQEKAIFIASDDMKVLAYFKKNGVSFHSFSKTLTSDNSAIHLGNYTGDIKVRNTEAILDVLLLSSADEILYTNTEWNIPSGFVSLAKDLKDENYIESILLKKSIKENLNTTKNKQLSNLKLTLRQKLGITSYKLIFGSFLNNKKYMKLQDNPSQFFNDSKNTITRSIGNILGL